MMMSAAALVAFVTLGSFSLANSMYANPRHCGGTVRHVHLAVGPDPSSEMIVSFASIPSLYDAPVGGVLVGLSPTELNNAFLQTEAPSSYNQTVSAGRGNYGDNDELYFSPYYHHVTISGLEPSTTYFYKPIVHSNLRGFSKDFRNAGHSGAGSEMKEAEEEAYREEGKDIPEEGWTRHRYLSDLPAYDGSKYECPSPDKIRTFKTGPRPTTPGDDSTVAAVSFAIVGDLGQYKHSEQTMSSLIRSRHDIDAIILAGDIAYPRMDHRQWDTFFDLLDDYPIAEYVPMQIVPGNHDIDKHKRSREIFLAFEHRFRMPRVHPPELGLYDGPEKALDMDKPPYPLPYEWGNAYYAYTYGPARFIMISSYSSMEPGSIQYDWIVEEFKSVDRSVTPWVIAVLHTPVYNTFTLHRHDPQIAAAKLHLEPLFTKHNINFVFTGHIHAYLRTTNVVNGTVDASGPVHITVGAGGRKCEAPFYSEVPEPWVRVRDATMFGYGMFRIFNRTHAQWDWVHTGHADDHELNQLRRTNKTLPAGPAIDRELIVNQYYR